MVNRNIVESMIDRVLSESVIVTGEDVRSDLLGAVVRFGRDYRVSFSTDSSGSPYAFVLAGGSPDAGIPKDVVSAARKDVYRIVGTHLAAMERDILEALTSRHKLKRVDRHG